MAYILDRMLFIHIPKCAGHTVWEVMKANGGFRAKDRWGGRFSHHQSAFGLRQALGKTWCDYQPVTLVRNPWERAVSLYFGRNRNKNPHTPAGFAKFMRRYERLSKYRWNPHYPLSRMITPEMIVFKVDEIERLWGWMESNLEIEIGTPKVRRSGTHRYVDRLHYRDYFTKQLRNGIAEVHQHDIARWGWKF